MVFVTVGNATQGFRRLLDAVDMLAGKGVFNDQVIIQAGNNKDFCALNCAQEDFFSAAQFAEMIRCAELVISHAGAGTLLHALQAGKVPIVMPRRKKYSEHVDDHQVELVRALTPGRRIVAAYEVGDLADAVLAARGRRYQVVPYHPSRMLDLVAGAIDELTGRRQSD